MPRGKKTRPYTSLQLKAAREQLTRTHTQLHEMALQVLQAVLGVSRYQALVYYNETANERGSIIGPALLAGIDHPRQSHKPRKKRRKLKRSLPA